MNDKNLLKNIQLLFSPKDVYIFEHSTLTEQRFMAEKYYDIAEHEWHKDRRKSKNFKIARDIYSNVMQQIENENILT